MFLKAFFMNMTQKNILKNESFSVFEGAIFNLFEHTKIWFDQMFFFYFLSHF